MALISACGGDVTNESYDGATRTAAVIVQGGGASGAPVADCEAEGCNKPRIIDGLAEQYRADAVARAAQASEPVQEDVTVLPAEPAAPGEPLPAAPEQAQ